MLLSQTFPRRQPPQPGIVAATLLRFPEHGPRNARDALGGVPSGQAARLAGDVVVVVACPAPHCAAEACIGRDACFRAGHERRGKADRTTCGVSGREGTRGSAGSSLF